MPLHDFGQPPSSYTSAASSMPAATAVSSTPFPGCESKPVDPIDQCFVDCNEKARLHTIACKEKIKQFTCAMRASGCKGVWCTMPSRTKTCKRKAAPKRCAKKKKTCTTRRCY